MEFRKTPHFVSRVFFIFVCGQRPKFAVFAPVFRLSSRPGESPLFSRLWAHPRATTICCALAPRLPVSVSEHLPQFFFASAWLQPVSQPSYHSNAPQPRF